MNQANTKAVMEEGRGVTGSSGSSYGNGGLSDGLGVSPAALAYAMLAKLQEKYQQVLAAKAELSTIGGKAAEEQIQAQNDHYAREVADQAQQMLSDAAAQFATAGATAAMLGARGPQLFKESNIAKEAMEASELEGKNLSSLQKELTLPDAQPEANVKEGDEPLPDVEGNEKILYDKLMRQEGPDIDAAAEEKNPQVVKNVGARLRTEVGRDPSEALKQKVRLINDKIEVRLARNSQNTMVKAIHYQAAAMKLQMVNQAIQMAFQGMSSAFKYLSKTQGLSFIRIRSLDGNGHVRKHKSGEHKGEDVWLDGESEYQAHNAAQMSQFYGQLAQTVMNNETQGIFKAWDLENAVMTQIYKAIADSQRV